MTLRTLPEIRASRMPNVCAYEMDSSAVERWHAEIRAADQGEATISILDVIGDDPWSDGGVTTKRIAAALRAIGARDVVVDINSPGGDYFEGIAIYNLLRAHPHKVTVRVLGLAASVASVIAMAGDEIQIGLAGFIMVHNTWGVTIGNRHDLTEAIAALESFDDAMAAVYAARAGVEKAVAAEWMDAETWFSGRAAVEAGIADQLLSADVASEAPVAAGAQEQINAIRRVDALLAKQGLSRSERRALLGGIKGGTRDAAPTATHDAGAELVALLEGLRSTLNQ